MMNNAKAMQADIKELLKYARKIMENCTDNALKKQLATAMERMETLTTQLRIVTAVKIAEARDSDSEKQLIISSQNLMASINTMLKASEAASLRSMETTAHVALAAIKFRKKVFKKGASAKSLGSGASASTAAAQKDPASAAMNLLQKKTAAMKAK